MELYVCFLCYAVMVYIGATFDWCHLNQARTHADLNHLVWCRQVDLKFQSGSGVSDTCVCSFFGCQPLPIVSSPIYFLVLWEIGLSYDWRNIIRANSCGPPSGASWFVIVHDDISLLKFILVSKSTRSWYKFTKLCDMDVLLVLLFSIFSSI